MVLVVEDNRDIRESIVEVLHDEGYDVRMAADGLEAVDALGEKRPAMVLLDLMMPRMTGWELLDYMRQNSQLAGIPVLVMSASTIHAPAGAAYIPKPINLDQLLAFVKSHCP